MSDSSAFRFRRVGILSFFAVASMCACTGSSYMGISLVEGVGDPALRLIAQRASVGDKQAQLDLGIRYEEGRGVAANVATAKKLYRLAAADSGGTLWVYTPSVGSGTRGRVLPIDRGTKIDGLKEAKVRLEALQ